MLVIWTVFVSGLVVVNLVLICLLDLWNGGGSNLEAWNIVKSSSNASTYWIPYTTPVLVNDSRKVFQGSFGSGFSGDNVSIVPISSSIPVSVNSSLSFQKLNIFRYRQWKRARQSRTAVSKRHVFGNVKTPLPRDFHDYSVIENVITRPHRNVRVRYFPRLGVGIGNMYRSFRSFLLLSVYDNFTFCIDYPLFFTIMDSSLEILRCSKTSEVQRWSNSVVDDWVAHAHCNFHIEHSIGVGASNDLIRHFMGCKDFVDRINNEHFPVATNRFALSCYLGRFLFQPKQYIIDYGNEILDNMEGMKVGIQLRFGGKIAAEYDSTSFLKLEKMDKILGDIRKKMEGVDNYSIFVSSDTVMAPDLLKPLNKTVHVANQFILGHTKRSNKAFLERAVLDLYVLSRCDRLFTTFYSSFGVLARDISLIQYSYELRSLSVCYQTDH